MAEDVVVVLVDVVLEREGEVRAEDAALVVVVGMDAAAVVAVSGDEDAVETVRRRKRR